MSRFVELSAVAELGRSRFGFPSSPTLRRNRSLASNGAWLRSSEALTTEPAALRMIGLGFRCALILALVSLVAACGPSSAPDEQTGTGSAASSTLDPDINGDGTVSAVDLAIAGRCVGRDLAVASECRCADVDGDGDVDQKDVATVSANMRRTGFPKGPNPCVPQVDPRDVDDDRDGFTENQGDCNDANAAVRPGAPERCNGIDDDCDNASDEGFDAGTPCSAGVGACARPGGKVCATSGDSTICNAVPGTPQEEVCGNGIDEDCDGADLPCPTPSDTPTNIPTATQTETPTQLPTETPSPQATATSIGTVTPPGGGLVLTIADPPAGGVVTAQPIKVSGTVSESSALVRVSSSFASVRNEQFTAPGVALSEGENLLRATATGMRGQQVELTHAVTLDTKPPVIELLSPADRSFAPGPVVQVLGIVRDVTLVTCTLNDQDLSVAAGRAEFRFTRQHPLSEGENTLDIRCTDRAGHVSTQTVTVFSDSSPLAVTGVVPTSGAVGVSRSTPVTVSFSESINPASVGSASFFLTARGAIFGATITVAADSRSATLVPAVPLPAGERIRVDVTSGTTDLAGNPMVASFSSIFRTAGTTSDPVAVLGEVFDDSRSLPLAGASITVTDADTGAVIATLESADEGDFFFLPNVQRVRIRATKDGFTTSEREAVATGGSFVELLDMRLTPLAQAVSVQGSLGQSISSSSGDVLRLPAGAFTDARDVTFTVIGEQGPRSPFPLGWAPVGIAEVDFGGELLALASIELTGRAESASRDAVAARYDPDLNIWAVLELLHVGDDGVARITAVDQSGQYAILVPDQDPEGPGLPTVGNPLPAGLAKAFPDEAEATGLVDPSQARVDDPTPALATVTVTGSEVLRSGTRLGGDFMERFMLAAGGDFAPPDTSQDLVAYRVPNDVTGTTVRARFAVAPSKSFSLTEATSGLITVDVSESRLLDRALVTPDGGGPILDDGSRLIVPAGSFLAGLPISMRRFGEASFPAPIPDGFSFLAGFTIDLAGQTSNQSLSLVLEGPDAELRTGDTVVVVQLANVLGQLRLIPVALGLRIGESIATESLVNGVQFPGITQGGRYAFLSFPGSLVPVSGTVRHSDGVRSGHLVEIVGIRLTAVSGTAGAFALLARPGPFQLIATGGHIQDQATASGNTTSVLDEIVIQPTPPEVRSLIVRPPPLQGLFAGPVVLLGKPAPIIDDDNAGDSRGDGDGLIEPGERIELTLFVLNEGNRSAPSGFMVLDILTQQGTITTSPTTIDLTPPPPETVIQVGPFTFDVPPGSDPSTFQYDLIYQLGAVHAAAGTMRGNEIPFRLPLGVEHHHVSLGSEITVSFSEPVAVAGVRAAASVVHDDTNEPVEIAVVSTSDPLTFKLRPTRLLDDDTIYRITLSSAVIDSDGRGLRSAPYVERFRTADRTVPPPIEPGHIDASVPDARGMVRISGAAGSVNPSDTVIALNETTGLSILALVNPDGSFTVELLAHHEDIISLIVRDRSDNQTQIPISTLVRRDELTGQILGALIAPAGGSFSRDGITLVVPSNAIRLPTEFSVRAVATPFELPADLQGDAAVGAAFHALFDPVQRFELQFPEHRLRTPVEVELLAAQGTLEGDLFALAREIDVTIGGLSVDLDRLTGVLPVDNPRRPVKRLEIVETATAKKRGDSMLIVTDSPPFPGVLDPGLYTVLAVKGPLAFLSGTLVSEEGQGVGNSLVSSGPDAVATAPLASQTDSNGTFVVADGSVQSTLEEAITTRLQAFDPGRNRTIVRDVDGVKLDASPPSTTVFDLGDVILPINLPRALIDVLGDIEPPQVSIRVSGAGLTSAFAQLGIPIDVIVTATDDDSVSSLSVTLDVGDGPEPVPLGADGRFSFTPTQDALITIRAIASDANGNEAEDQKQIRTLLPGEFPGSLSGVGPVVLLPLDGESGLAEGVLAGGAFAIAQGTIDKGDDDVAFDKPVSLRFSEPLDPTSVTPLAVRVLDPEGNPVPVSLTLEDNNSRIVVEPEALLRLGACYTAEISSVRDADGDSFFSGSLALNVPAPVQSRSVALQNAREQAFISSSEVLSIGGYTDSSDIDNKGELALYRIREGKHLRGDPLRIAATKTNGRPLTVVVDSENRAFVGNQFLGPIASMRAVLNPLAFLFPGLGLGSTGSGPVGGLLQCVQNPLLCLGVQLVWESFPLPPSNIEVYDVADVGNPPQRLDIEELNRLKLASADEVPLQDDVFTLNIPGLWGPNTWPIKATTNKSGVAIANSHMNVEFLDIGESDQPSLKSRKAIERVMGVGQQLGRCQGGGPNDDRVCLISSLPNGRLGSFAEAGADQCGTQYPCVATHEFRDVAFFEVSDSATPRSFVASTEDSFVRLVETGRDAQNFLERQFIDQTLGKIAIAGADSPTLAAAQRFAWIKDDPSHPEIADLLFIEGEGYGLKIYDVADPRDPQLLGAIPTIDGNMSVDECRGLIYLRDGVRYHVVDFNDPRSPRELNAPGLTSGRGGPFAVSNSEGWNYARMTNRDSTVVIPGRDGFAVVNNRSCGRVSRRCEPFQPKPPSALYSDGCEGGRPQFLGSAPVRAACLDFAILPDEDQFYYADGPDPIVAVSIFLPDPENPDQTVPVESAKVRWSVEGPLDAPSERISTLIDGVAAITIGTTGRAGDTYVVTATVTELIVDGKAVETVGLVKRTGVLTVNPGPADTITFDPATLMLPADDETEFDVSAIVRDVNGNLVADGTHVTWMTPGDNNIEKLEGAETTLDGRVDARFRAGNVCSTKSDIMVGLAVGDLVEFIGVNAEPVDVSLLVDKSTLDVTLGETALLSATFSTASNSPIPDGTRVRWFASNGSIQGDSVTSGGQARARLSAQGGRLGASVVSVSLGKFGEFERVEFISSAELTLQYEHDVLLSDADQDQVHIVQREDDKQFEFPLYTSTTAKLRGPPNAIVSFEVEGLVPIFDLRMEEFPSSAMEEAVSGTLIAVDSGQIDPTTGALGTTSLRLARSVPIVVPLQPSFDVNDNFSVTTWLRPTSLGDGVFVENAGLFSLALRAGSVVFSVNTPVGLASVTSASPVRTDEWQQVNATYSTRGIILRLTSSSGSTVSQSAANGPPNDHAATIVLGGGFEGNLDDIVISKLDSDIQGLVAIQGLDANGQVQLDAAGEAEITVEALNQGNADNLSDLETVSISANISTGTSSGSSHSTFAGGGALAVPSITKAELKLVRMKLAEITGDFVARTILGSDPDGPFLESLAPEVAAGMLFIGDVRDIVIESLLMSGECDESSQLVLTFAALGLVTDFCQFGILSTPVCAPLNLVFTGVKIFLKTIGRVFKKVAHFIGKQAIRLITIAFENGVAGVRRTIDEIERLRAVVDVLRKNADDVNGPDGGVLKKVDDICALGGNCCATITSAQARLDRLDGSIPIGSGQSTLLLPAFNAAIKALDDGTAAKVARVINELSKEALESVQRAGRMAEFVSNLAIVIGKPGDADLLDPGHIAKVISEMVPKLVGNPTGTQLVSPNGVYAGLAVYRNIIGPDELVAHMADSLASVPGARHDFRQKLNWIVQGIIKVDSADNANIDQADDIPGLLAELFASRDYVKFGWSAMPGGLHLKDIADLVGPGFMDEFKSTAGAAKRFLDDADLATINGVVAKRLGGAARVGLAMVDTEWAKVAGAINQAADAGNFRRLRALCTQIGSLVLITPVDVGAKPKIDRLLLPSDLPLCAKLP